MHLRQIPFPILMLLGCAALVWAIRQPSSTMPPQPLPPGVQGHPAAAQTQPPQQSWAGLVSDSNCGAKHTASDGAAQCVSRCVASGAKYVLVADGSVFQVDPQNLFTAYAGKTVAVEGSLRGDTITAVTVSPVQQE